MIRLRNTDHGHVLLVRVIHHHEQLERGAFQMTAVIPIRWFGAIAILSTIGWTAAYITS